MSACMPDYDEKELNKMTLQKSNSQAGRKAINQKGKNNNNWKGGISKNRYKYKLRDMFKFPEKYKARRKVREALKLGRLKRKPCEKCNNILSEAHHEDYSKPLEIKWYCKKHHLELHRTENPTPDINGQDEQANNSVSALKSTSNKRDGSPDTNIHSQAVKDKESLSPAKCTTEYSDGRTYSPDTQLSKAQAIWEKIEKKRNFCDILYINDKELRDCRFFEETRLLKAKAQQHKETCQDWLDYILSFQNDNRYLWVIGDLKDTIKFYKKKGI